ncbi:hypothetical protein ACFVFN_36465, partial [Streptomyces pharetrae]
MKRAVVTRSAVAVMAVLALAGCGASGGAGSKDTGSEGETGAGPSASPSEEMRAVKAPKRFSTDDAIVLPESAGAGNVAIAG